MAAGAELFRRNGYTGTGLKQIVSEAKITLDPTTKPKSVDIAHTKGDLKGETVLGIYELKDDSLKVCFALGDENRQTALGA